MYLKPLLIIRVCLLFKNDPFGVSPIFLAKKGIFCLYYPLSLPNPIAKSISSSLPERTTLNRGRRQNHCSFDIEIP